MSVLIKTIIKCQVLYYFQAALSPLTKWNQVASDAWCWTDSAVSKMYIQFVSKILTDLDYFVNY